MHHLPSLSWRDHLSSGLLISSFLRELAHVSELLLKQVRFPEVACALVY